MSEAVYIPDSRSSALDLSIKGSMGVFSVASGADRRSTPVRYLQTFVTLAREGDQNERLMKNLAPVREVFGVDDLDFDQIMQRDVDDARVSTGLIPYLLDQAKTGLVKLFPACVLSTAGEFREACVHLNIVGTSDAEQLRGIDRIGGGEQAYWALPI